MRPYIICHMLSSIDGKIDSSVLQAVTGKGEYENTGSMLKGDAWICGRVTMQQHFAQDRPFISKSKKPAGPQPVFVARQAESYAISVDTLGKLRWLSSDIDGDHLICIVSERVTVDYLAMLREKGISYIVCGKSAIDLVKAVDVLGKQFGVRTLLLEGGGHINGAFLQADLVDEVSLLLVPGIDGRSKVPAVFDGIKPTMKAGVPLKLKSIERRKKDALWIRYKVVRPKEKRSKKGNA